MGQIYRDAQRVVVWLGEHENAGTGISSLLHELVQVLESSTDPERVDRVMTRLDAIKLFGQPWYSRQWVVQEFVLARELQFLFADDIVPAELLHECVNAVRQHFYDWSAVRTSQLFSIREARISSGSTEKHKNTKEKPNMNLIHCISEFATGRECSDARDYVFLMLNVTENDFGITPDYTLSLPQVATDMATRMLLAQDLSILHMSGSQPVDEPELASFAPLIPRDGRGVSLDNPIYQFASATHLPSSVQFCAPGIVAIKGVLLDKISRIPAPYRGTSLAGAVVDRGIRSHMVAFTEWFEGNRRNDPYGVYKDCSFSSPKPRARRVSSHSTHISNVTVRLHTFDDTDLILRVVTPYHNKSQSGENRASSHGTSSSRPSRSSRTRTCCAAKR
ncbi:hypothetical protein CC86DRAFT_432663 [Ophiobolus disseminans]|uniref:Heterokaryon incompatibility domain-containing protein n=1 Tax=Ophiobolus disseminans TaxID=1469910 RepID=A0A6A6ZD41_9PLEO|nr:hypothetical protein CC86DRAFT_432663 [Ophiobolus disseminans]